MVHSTIMFPFKREIMPPKVLNRLGSMLVELGEQLQGGGILAESFDNEVRWLKIDMEFVDLKEVEDLIVDARRIVYDAGQFLESSNILNCTDQKKREVVIDMIRRYCRMVTNYQPADYYNSSELHYLRRILTSMHQFTGPVDDDETRGSIFGHHLSDSIQGDQGSSTTASGGQVIGVAQDDDYFVGLNEQVDLILPHLVNEGGAGGAYRFISLWGMGGLGKTAIAKAIYNHPDVRGHFRHFSWASMPNDTSDGDILHRILDDLLPGWQRSSELQYNMSKTKSAEEDPKNKVWLLDTRFKKLLQNEKCLIVLDDIMSPGVLGVLNKAMSEGERTRSRIVLTTRNLKLSPCHLSPQCLIYVPQFLNDDQSWELLQKTAFRKQGKEMNNYLNKETCKELLRRCGGLPLAIVQLGELTQTEEWCSREALAAPEILFKSVPMKRRVLEVLATSYDELPHELRSCFRYLRNVHANVEIEVNKLHQLWVAESMISSYYLPLGESTLDDACYYLHVFASRSMVQFKSTRLLAF